MTSSKLINKQTLFLMCAAACINIFFFLQYDRSHFFSITQLHGHIGYNLCRYNTVGINPLLSSYIKKTQKNHAQLIDYAQCKEHDFGPPTDPFPINDTIGYGFILALLWMITKTFRFVDVQLLQMLLFIMSMPFLYNIALVLFNNKRVAFLSCIAQLFFLPLIAMNVQPVRDIWAYYGLIALLYGLVHYVVQQKNIWYIIIGFSLFALCQCIRPAAFMTVPTLSVVLVLFYFVQKNQRLLTALLILLITNILFFWLPFMVHNKIYYDRFIVGPAGQDLVEGLGEYNNKWGYKLDDQWIAQYIQEKYGFFYGTPEFDDAAKKEFFQSYHEDPFFYWYSVIRRIPRLIAPSLYAIFMQKSPFVGKPLRKKITYMFSTAPLFIDFMLRHAYIWFFLLLGYCGAVLLFLQGQYFALGLIMGIIAAGAGKLPSHIDYRYLVPFYWAFSFYVGVFLDYIISLFVKNK